MKTNKSIILLLGVIASLSACTDFGPRKRSTEDTGNATVYYLTRTYVDEADQYSKPHSKEPTPTVLKFDYKAMKTYKMTSDDILGDYSLMYGYHEYYCFDYSKLTVAVEYEDGVMTQYYLQFNDPKGEATMKKEAAKATVDGEEGTLPNTSNKEYSSAGILDLGFKFSIDEVSIKPDCLFPETYFYCEINYAIENNYIIQSFN